MSLLREIREQRGESLKGVAAAVGIDKGTLSRIERGQSEPTKTTAQKLFRYYGGKVPYASCLDPLYRESV